MRVLNTDIGSTPFYLQLCATRWAEDADVAERDVKVWNDICQYVTIYVY